MQSIHKKRNGNYAGKYCNKKTSAHQAPKQQNVFQLPFPLRHWHRQLFPKEWQWVLGSCVILKWHKLLGIDGLVSYMV